MIITNPTIISSYSGNLTIVPWCYNPRIYHQIILKAIISISTILTLLDHQTNQLMKILHCKLAVSLIILVSLSKQVSSVLNHQNHQINSNTTYLILLNHKIIKKDNNNNNNMFCKIHWTKYHSDQLMEWIACLNNNNSSSWGNNNINNSRNLELTCLVINNLLLLPSNSKSLG